MKSRWNRSVILLATTLACSRMYAQSVSTNNANFNDVRYANAFTGADAGAKIAAAIADLPSTGGIVDARGLTGSQTISSSLAVGSSTKPVRLILGTATISLSGTISVSKGSEVVGAGTAATVLNYPGSGDAISILDATDTRVSDLAVGLGSSATSIGIHLKATAVQSAAYNSLSHINIHGSSLVSGQTALKLEGTGYGTYQCVFNHFSDFSIVNVDVPVSDTGYNETNIFSNFTIAGYGASGSSASGVTVDGNREQYIGFWFGRGAGAATNLYGFHFTSTAGENIAIGSADIGTGSCFNDESTAGQSVLQCTTAGSTTYGDSSGSSVYYSLPLGRARNSSGYDVNAMSSTGADRHVFQAGVSGYSNGFAVSYQNAGPQGIRYVFNNGPVGIGQTPNYGGPGLGVSGPIWTSVNTVTFSATPTFDASLGNTQKITLTGSVTSSTLSNATPGQTLNFVICQDPGGSHTFVWPANVLGGMTLGSIASKCSAQSFIFDGTNAYALGSGSANM